MKATRARDAEVFVSSQSMLRSHFCIARSPRSFLLGQRVKWRRYAIPCGAKYKKECGSLGNCMQSGGVVQVAHHIDDVIVEGRNVHGRILEDVEILHFSPEIMRIFLLFFWIAARSSSNSLGPPTTQWCLFGPMRDGVSLVVKLKKICWSGIGDVRSSLSTIITKFLVGVLPEFSTVKWIEYQKRPGLSVSRCEPAYASHENKRAFEFEQRVTGNVGSLAALVKGKPRKMTWRAPTTTSRPLNKLVGESSHHSRVHGSGFSGA